MVDKLETTPPRVVVSYAYLVFSQPPNVYIRLCKRDNEISVGNHDTKRSGFQLIECSPNLPSVYIRLCKHGNHFTFLHSKTRSHPAVTFLYKNILERSISYVITQI